MTATDVHGVATLQTSVHVELHHFAQESRGRADNKKDVDMLKALRSQRRVTASLVCHEIGRREPLPAIPDAVRGAVTAL